MSMVWRIKKLIQDYRYKKVDIGDNSRINLGVQISNPQNMKIGDNGNGGVIAAGAVVTSSTEAYAGVPAKKIKKTRGIN